ncbi:amino acid permease [Pholiota conissans]|uniref:Amino acid permease n=1 Tax=Pholiota conissans TaxID=109636 RepID=A0A9P6D173_9AGAR|nr:amino acid permease [Pholiota conissans]
MEAEKVEENYIHNDNTPLDSRDAEAQGSKSSAIDPLTGQYKLVRQLKNRHIAMISIGGVIGTGLFLGTAGALQNGGPVGLLLGYTVIGTICYCIMISVGEMIAYLPIPGGHVKLAERFVDPALSFTMGWNYWYTWTIILPAELSAASVLVGFWDRSIDPAVWITILMVLVIAINLLGAGAYGEAEFLFASIKVVTIVGLIILGIILDLGGGPDHDRIGFRYWKDPGPFVQFRHIAGSKGRFLGFCSVLTQAAFSFIGTETVAIAAGEAKNPRRNIPKAINRVSTRILLFYIGGTAVIGLLVPSNSPGLNLAAIQGTAGASPFVIAIERAGIKVLPSIINACLITSASSAASSDIYTSSRVLYGLAAIGNAPKIFLRTTRHGLPYVAVTTSSLFALLGYMGTTAGSGRVFGWFSNMTAISGLMAWFGIGITYLRFYEGMKVQGIDRQALPFYSKLQPFAAWYALITCIVISFLSGWEVFLQGGWATDTFLTNYLPLVLFPILYLGSKFYYKQPIKKPHEMDFVTNIKEVEATTYNDPPPRNKFEAVWQWIM